MFLRNWLEIEYLKGIDLDDPHTTELRRRAIRENSFLYQIYCSWYQLIVTSIPPGRGQIVELGSGAGFLDEYIPGLITSEMFFLNGLCVLLDGQKMPFADGTLKTIGLTNVLHHIPSSRHFFSEAARVTRPGGVISMIESWVSPWSKLIYTYLHHEPFDPQATSWEFPAWRVECITPFMPFAYLFSGGVSMRPLMPGWGFHLVCWLESLFSSFMPQLAMFAYIVLVRKADDEMD